MPSCVYRNCKNTYVKHRNLYTFHRFPPKSNEELRKKWLVSCGLEVDFDCSRSRICSAHFKPEDYERDLKSELMGQPARNRLKDNAVPCFDLSKIKEEKTEEHDEQTYIPEYRPNFQLEQLADLAVNRALDDSNFNNARHQQLQEPPVELIVPQPVNNLPQPVVSTVQYAPSSLPASQNWPGEYEFNVSFSYQEKNTKGATWTHSKILDKIYVNKDAPCPINFSANTIMPDNVMIRAMALYSCPESASEIVARCSNHSSEEKARDVFEAEHLIRSESANAVYEIDPVTGRHSVLVPFENPPVGQQFSTYIYKFTCFGSCPFGPNRRPLMLVFTLEKGNRVLGRRKVDLKICACPGRDRKTDEQQALALKNGGTSKRKNHSDQVTLSETFEFTRNVILPFPKKTKTTNNQEEPRFIKVEDPGCYEFLIQMKELFECCKTLNKQQSLKNVNQQQSPGSDA